MTTGTNLFESLKADLKKLLHEHTMSVLFTKKDGTQRTMLCTLNPDLLPVVDKQEGDEVKRERKESMDSLRVWDLEKKDWRAFRIDSIVSYIKA
jgi:CRISPR/Cas system-associated endoribonuclease Cas2